MAGNASGSAPSAASPLMGGTRSADAVRSRRGACRVRAAEAAEHRYGNVTTPQFVALAEQVSGMQLDHFFDVWLYQPEKPTSW